MGEAIHMTADSVSGVGPRLRRVQAAQRIQQAQETDGYNYVEGISVYSGPADSGIGRHLEARGGLTPGNKDEDGAAFLAQDDTKSKGGRGPGGSKVIDSPRKAQEGLTGFARAEASLSEAEGSDSPFFNGMTIDDTPQNQEESGDPHGYGSRLPVGASKDDFIERLALAIVSKHASEGWDAADKALISRGFPAGSLGTMYASGIVDINVDKTLYVVAGVQEEEILGEETELHSYVGDPEQTAQREPDPDRVFPYGDEELKHEVDEREDALSPAEKKEARLVRDHVKAAYPHIAEFLREAAVHPGLDEEDAVRGAIMYAFPDGMISKFVQGWRSIKANIRNRVFAYMVPVRQAIIISDRLDNAGFEDESIKLMDRIESVIRSADGNGGGGGAGSSAVPFSPSHWQELKDRGLTKDVPEPSMRQTDYVSPAEKQRKGEGATVSV